MSARDKCSGEAIKLDVGLGCRGLLSHTGRRGTGSLIRAVRVSEGVGQGGGRHSRQSGERRGCWGAGSVSAYMQTKWGGHSAAEWTSGRGQGPDRAGPWAFLKAGQIRDVLFNKKPH